MEATTPQLLLVNSSRLGYGIWFRVRKRLTATISIKRKRYSRTTDYRTSDCRVFVCRNCERVSNIT